MNLSNPLPATWEAVRVARGAITLAGRVFEAPPSRRPAQCQQTLQDFQRYLRKDTDYEEGKALSSLPRLNRTTKLRELEKEINGLLVLGLWATFERFLRDYLQEVLKPQGQLVPLADLLRYNRLCDDIQRWKMGDILDFLKENVSDPGLPTLIKDAKYIMTYRNLVAHANPQKNNMKSDIEHVHDTLNKLINILLQY
jgi:hypothetical protein